VYDKLLNKKSDRDINFKSPGTFLNPKPKGRKGKKMAIHRKIKPCREFMCLRIKKTFI